MNDLADRIPDDGVYDAVALIHDYPSRVIAQVFGSEQDEVTSFATVVETIFDAQRGIPDAKPQAWPAMQALDAHISALIERKRDHPAEDLITDLIRAETEDGRLSPAITLPPARTRRARGLDNRWPPESGAHAAALPSRLTVVARRPSCRGFLPRA